MNHRILGRGMISGTDTEGLDLWDQFVSDLLQRLADLADMGWFGHVVIDVRFDRLDGRIE